MIKKTSLIIVSLSLLTLQGCSYFKPYKMPISQGVIIKQDQINLLQEGLTKKQVQTILGPPFGENAFNPYHWEYVFYTTNPNFHPKAIKHLVIHFDKDQYLESWEVKDKDFNLNEKGFFESLVDA